MFISSSPGVATPTCRAEITHFDHIHSINGCCWIIEGYFKASVDWAVRSWHHSSIKKHQWSPSIAANSTTKAAGCDSANQICFPSLSDYMLCLHTQLTCRHSQKRTRTTSGWKRKGQADSDIPLLIYFSFSHCLFTCISVIIVVMMFKHNTRSYA